MLAAERHRVAFILDDVLAQFRPDQSGLGLEYGGLFS